MVGRVVTRFIALSICVCYLILWIFTRTKVYEDRWWAVVMKKTSTIYFGIHGVSILIYTIPMLFVAVLGCLYLHLCTRVNPSILQQPDRRNTLYKDVPSWRLFLVKGPLGIVSRTEMAFLAIFVILLVFSFFNFIYRGTTSNIILSTKFTKRSYVYLDAAALWVALVGNICLACMFYPVTRGSSILPLFGLHSESCVRYHKLLGNTAMTLFTVHGALYVLYWGLTGNLREMLKWEKRGISYLPGEITLVAGIVMWVATYPKIRKNMFELFYYTHHLYIIFIIFFMLHVRLYDTFMMLPGFYLFAIDRYLRLLQSQQHVKLISARVLPCQFVGLNFAKTPGLKYPPASSIFVNVPMVSRLQWHPFTVCSNCDLEPDTISVLIKSEGDWSRKLYQILSSHDPSVDHFPVSVEGPYGRASTHFLGYDTLVMVSGGSGITPFISIIRGLIHASSIAQKTPRVVLISAFKRSADLTVLDLLLPLSASSTSSSALSKLNIQIEAYVTREHEQSSKSKAISTIRFKPKSSDAPISPTLGPNSWLWLAMIISASFIISMVLIAVLTKYFLHPIEINPKNLYARTLKTIFYILSFCVGIVVTASAAFICSKRQIAKESSQKENNMIPSVIDLEMESLPGHCIAQVTNVHYGAKPDLRKISNLFDGGSVGVLVCGPKKMQREVASICSTCTTESVRFESISFTF